ncbi:MAG: TonB-dependent receptor [Thermoanaerobaculia bacterium]
MSLKILWVLSFLVFVSAAAAVRAQEVAPTPTPTPHVSENVVVKALRADDVAPVTKTDLDRAELTAKSWGQEMPVLLQESPSVTGYSETGSGEGYAYLSLRGIGQTRVNMTFDGVPLNEPEDSAVYTTDFANLTGNVASVQVQRGVGTSTFGAAAFAGSVNFESVDAARAPGLSVSLGGGSFGTARASADWNAGIFGGGWRLSLRPSWQTTDGFREHSGVKQDSLFFTAVRDFETSSLRISGFVGEERIQQSFNAVEPDVLAKDLAYNPMSPNERDHFHEYLATAQWTAALGDNGSFSLQPYVVGAGGWYRLYADETTLTDLQEYGLSWLFGGGIATYTQKMGALRLTLGAHAYDYKSTHTLDEEDGTRLYTNHGTKSEVSGFVKLLGDLGRWHPFLDAQVRYAHLAYSGDVGDAGRGWTFFNPKAGVRLDLSDRASAYVSVGRTEREPARSDILLGEDNASTLPDFDAVKPESVWDVELGAEWRAKDLVLRANLYDMEFRNEIALTGELSPIGLPLRRNVEKSFRRGLELDASWQALSALRVTAAMNLNRSRISEWTQFYDVYDVAGNITGSTPRTFHDVAPVGTPPFVATAGFETTPLSDVTAGLTGRYVAASWLDNTNTLGLEAPRFFQLDASFRFDLSRLIAAGKPRLSVRVNNLLDNRRIFPSGYSYLYVTRDSGQDTAAGIPYYYAAATRSVSVTLDLGLW